MRIIDVSSTEDGVKVIALDSENMEEIFFVQITGNEYRPDLGCWITTETSNGNIDPDDFPEFDIDEIIDAAEKHATTNFNDEFEEKEIGFNCEINNQSVYMRIKKITGEVELVIRDDGYIGSYQLRYIETGMRFCSTVEAEEYADQFRTDDYQDCSGLSSFMKTIREM